MPAYEFKCKSCGDIIMLVKSFTDETVPDCSDCKAPMVRNFNVGGVYVR